MVSYLCDSMDEFFRSLFSPCGTVFRYSTLATVIGIALLTLFPARKKLQKASVIGV
jgi:hypothetical protein